MSRLGSSHSHTSSLKSTGGREEDEVALLNGKNLLQLKQKGNYGKIIFITASLVTDIFKLHFF